MERKKGILLIDDDRNFLTISKKILTYEGYQVTAYDDPREALDDPELSRYDLIISDLVMPQMDGIEVLKAIKRKSPGSAVIILTGNGTIDTAVEAIKAGACTYLEKPVVPDKLVTKIRNVLGMVDSKHNEITSVEKEDLFVGKSREIIAIQNGIQKICEVDSPVLIYGSSGTGKEMIANLVHDSSRRHGKAFVKVNCAAIPDSLLESELFGFEKGAFTGAIRDRRGKMELADQGTLFLDEISELSLMAQSKILRAIQEKEIDRIGSERTTKVDFRLICASNKDLKQLVREGKFREDLFYRINVISFELPPLCQRRSDIPEFVDYFRGIYASSFQKRIPPFSKEVMEAFLRYDWPGNVRELKNVIERVMVFAEDGAEVRLADLPSELLRSGKSAAAEGAGSYKDAKYEFERGYLIQMLEKNDWNITNTAKEIGLARRNLHEKIRQFHLREDGFDDE